VSSEVKVNLNNIDESTLNKAEKIETRQPHLQKGMSPVRILLGLVLAGAAFIWLSAGSEAPDFARFLLPAGILALTFLVARVNRNSLDSFGRTSPKGGRVKDNLMLASAVFEATSEGIMITDADNNIVSVNSAFTTITGYSSAEVFGKNPSLLRSERHDDAFFNKMWNVLLRDGRWDGEMWNCRRNGEVFATWMSITAIHDEQGNVRNYVGILADIDRRKKAEEEAQYRIKTDVLTGLVNRRAMMRELRQTLILMHGSDRQAALFNININNFRFLNESLGSAGGDQLLVVAAQRIRNSVTDECLVSRIGGDEFAVLVPSVDGPETCRELAMKIRSAIASPMKLSGQEERLTVMTNIGVVISPDYGVEAEDLFRKADIAGTYAKKNGKDGIALFDDGMDRQARERLVIESRLRKSLENEEFKIHYQPKVDLRSGFVVGMEALVRWEDPEQGMVSPDKFIPIAEETGLIEPLGEWVLGSACKQAKQWLDDGLPPLHLSVNLSARQLQSDTIAEDILRTVADSGFDPGHLDLEITESAIMTDTAKSIAVIEALGKEGITFAIDDFGTGYSSLSYLKNLPISALKIDRTFVNDIETHKESARLAAAILALGQSLNLKVIAEGVETERQLAFLKQHWCDEIQGFIFAKPLPPEEFKALLIEGKRL